MGYAKPTQARLIDQRARRRATQDLIEKYRDEFDALYWQHKASNNGLSRTQVAAQLGGAS